MTIVDAHLDLAYNAQRGRDPRMAAKDQPVVENEIATVGLPDLRAGGVDLICATIFAEPLSEKKPRGYRDGEGAHQHALWQIDWYRRQIDDGLMRPASFVMELPGQARHSNILKNVGTSAQTPQSFILLLEGADPIRSHDDVKTFFNAGVRIVGLAWKRTRYAGGTGAPGPLTAEGVALVRVLDRFGIIHDASHLAEESFWQLMDLTAGPVIASHSNCREIVPSDRQLSDDMIREIVKRGGVIGINFYEKFLLPPEQHGKRRATLADVAHHMRHICDLAGSANHVGLGTDMDGGLGRDQIPVEITTSADLPRVADALHDARFSDQDIRGVMSENWLRFFTRNLPKS